MRPRTNHHTTFRPKLSVHPTNRLLWQFTTVTFLHLYDPSTYFSSTHLQGGRFVTCDITSTLPKMLCDIMSTLSWSKIWTVCHNILGPICDVLPAVWRHVDVLSQDFSQHVCDVQPAFQRSVDVLSPYFWTSVMSRPPAQQTVDVLSQDLRKNQEISWDSPFKDPLSHMKVSRNWRIFGKNGPFVTFGRNVTAKLDEKYTDKMSQTLGQNITVRRFVTLWQTVQIY